PSWATRSRATARSAPPANTSSICACSRSHGDTLFGTDVGSFLSWLDHLREEPTSVPFYTDRETRPRQGPKRHFEVRSVTGGAGEVECRSVRICVTSALSWIGTSIADTSQSRLSRIWSRCWITGQPQAW